MFLQPGRYESKASFKYLGTRSLTEVETLLKSSRLNETVVKNLELRNHWQVDSENALSIVLEATELKTDSRTGLIELKATHTNREDARNIAASIPASLNEYERKVAAANLTSRIEEAQMSATQVRDEAEIEKQALARLIQVRADVIADPVAQLDIDAARQTREGTLSRAIEYEQQIRQLKQELSNPRDWVEVYTDPVIAQSPVGKKADESLGALIVRVLLIGLATALALPYLLELVCPRRSRGKKADRTPEFDHPDLLESGING